MKTRTWCCRESVTGTLSEAPRYEVGTKTLATTVWHQKGTMHCTNCVNVNAIKLICKGNALWGRWTCFPQKPRSWMGIIEVEGGCTHCDEAACVCVCVCVCLCMCPPPVQQAVYCRACVYVVLSAEEASLVVFLAVSLQWRSRGLVGFPPEVRLSPASLLWPTSFTPPPHTSIPLSSSSSSPPNLLPPPVILPLSNQTPHLTPVQAH